MFSIILPCHNLADDLPNTIAAITSQLEENWELICINMGSTDGTLGLLMKAARDDHRIRVVHQPEVSVDAALNRGLSAALGQWLVFHDGRTSWLPQHLTMIRGQIARSPELDAIRASDRGVFGTCLRRDVMLSAQGFLICAEADFSTRVMTQIAASAGQVITPLPPRAIGTDSTLPQPFAA